MSALWPRLPAPLAGALFAEMQTTGTVPSAAISHPEQVYAQVGGRASEAQLRELRDAVLEVARSAGFPDRPLSVAAGPEFDRAVAPVLHSHMPMTWSEAGSRDVWSFTALVLLPDVTEWRWQRQGIRNRERWVATDLTRHTWARGWWLMAAFESDPGLALKFQESELNQLLERRSIGGYPPLLASLARYILMAVDSGAPRRPLIRDVTRRLRRQLAFVDAVGLTDKQLADWTLDLVFESVDQLRSEGGEGLDSGDPAKDLCPQCGHPLVSIVRGFPGPELIERERRREVILGGCCIDIDDPTIGCTECGWRGRWGDLSASAAPPTLSPPTWT